ncbi:hypothetical protein BZA70DRAFT_279095 [Myxozyma melibiosi]|uniref:Autophagy-related protein 29 n=1 Tax=Myxozyma melibiosi TaxID=54550 RepID=A0ABR1F5I9_9ASCO
MLSRTEDSPLYTVYLRFPFPREGFVEPSPVDWNAEKEQELWTILSRSNKRAEIKWPQLAEYFKASIPFLLQQAAWLYERELQQVREEMQRVTAHSALFLDQSTQSLHSREGGATLTSDDVRRVQGSAVNRTYTDRYSDETRSIDSRHSGEDRKEEYQQQQNKMKQQHQQQLHQQQQQQQPLQDPLYDRRQHSRTAYIQSSFNRQPTPTQRQRASPQLSSAYNPPPPPPGASYNPETGQPIYRDASSSSKTAQNSTGSSFSDLSDASMSRSALEEALLSDINRNGGGSGAGAAGGGGVSKMSMISGVLRSRYFDPR